MKENPFRFGAPVEGVFYFERKRLRDSCEALLANGMSVMLVGPRRLGKTSFAKNFCKMWETKRLGDALILDVYNVSSHQDFLLQLLNALQSKRSLWEKVCDWTKRLPERLKPANLSVGNDDIGKLTLSWLAEEGAQEKKLYIIETLESLATLDGHVCVVIDECQQLSKDTLGDEGWLEATLRQMLQTQAGKVSYLLTGSRRDVVHAMVNDNQRPLYRAFHVIDFPALESDFSAWIIERFNVANVNASMEVVSYLRQQVNDSTNYVQMVCFHLVAMDCGTVDKTLIDTVLANIVTQNAYSYETHLHNLSPAQQRVLRMLALEDEGYYSEPLLKRYEINSTAHVTNAINALKRKNILDQEAAGRGRVSFDDPLFKLWIRYKWGGLLPGQTAQPTLI
ncbi:MAG: hypothetical protein V4735_03385 [Pseudomonadota bacterium]